MNASILHLSREEQLSEEEKIKNKRIAKKKKKRLEFARKIFPFI